MTCLPHQQENFEMTRLSLVAEGLSDGTGYLSITISLRLPEPVDQDPSLSFDFSEQIERRNRGQRMCSYL